MDKKFKILLVDDEKGFLDITKIRLEISGYFVITAEDGLEALEMAKTQNPDLIILDVMLPKMDGHKVCKMLKINEEFKDIPIIMLSALSQDSDIQAGYNMGADKYLTKPFDADELLKNISTLLSDASNQDLTGFLKGIDLFSPLTESEISSIIENSQCKSLSAGTTYIHEGAIDNSLYIIVSGESSVKKKDTYGNMLEINKLSSTMCVGEMSFLLGEPRSATVITTSATTILQVPKEAMFPIMKNRPDIEAKLAEIIAKKKAENDNLFRNNAGTMNAPAMMKYYIDEATKKLQQSFALKT